MKNQSENQKPFYKRTWVIIIGIIALLIIIANIGDDKKNETSQEQVPLLTSEQEPKQQTEKREPTAEELLSAEIGYHKNTLTYLMSFNNSKYTGEIRLLNLELDILESYAETIRKALLNENDSIKLFGNKMQAQLKKIYSTEFPRLRKEYAFISKEKLWVNDIEVSVSGTNYTTLTFTGSIFASNANKQEFQNKLNEAFYRFRFKRIIYKWYKYDDEYTYYDLKSLKDTDI